MLVKVVSHDIDKDLGVGHAETKTSPTETGIAMFRLTLPSKVDDNMEQFP